MLSAGAETGVEKVIQEFSSCQKHCWLWDGGRKPDKNGKSMERTDRWG